MDASSFAELLREKRLAHGLTQEELAERALRLTDLSAPERWI